jgi:ABC-2 type transport system permease protein
VKLRAGSALWLLRHELRLYVYRLGSASRRGPSRSNLALLALAQLALHAFAFKLIGDGPGADGAFDQARLTAITLLYAVAFSMMLSQGLKASVEVLFERGDLDLLLSSPLPSRSIFVVRLAAVVLGSASLYLFLLTPFAHIGLLTGQPRWLAIYPVVLGTAALAASLSMLLTLALVRAIGIRRTRVVGQVLGALVGAVFFLLSQIYANTLGPTQQRLTAWVEAHTVAGAAFGPDSMLWLPGRATLGDALPLLTIAVLGATAFALTVHFTHGFFVHGVQQAVSLVRTSAAPAGGQRYRFRKSLAVTVLLKEWRLIVRDPQLISQVLLQLLYLLPLSFMLVFKASTVIPGLGASLIFLCTSLTTALAWLIIAAEDAPDLLRSSPARAATIARAKLAAAVMPALLLMVAPLIWIGLRQPRAALLLWLCVAGATASAALVVRWCARPAARSDFRLRAKGNFLSNFFELATALAWAGLGWVMLTLAQAGRAGSWVAPVGGVLFTILSCLLALAWWRRQRA